MSAKDWYSAVASLETCVLCGDHGVQVSHSNAERGIGQKSPPYFTAALCPRCHSDIDNGRHYSKEQRRLLHYVAIARTHARLIEAGRLKLV